MAVSDKSQQWFLARYRALFGKIDSPEGYQSWMDETDVDGSTFIEAFHRIIDQRREKEQYAAYDKPRLLEIQAVYYKLLREKRASFELDALNTYCGFCENRGRRFLVVHTNHRLEDGELITAIPEFEQIRRWVYVVSTPCTCPSGDVIMRYNKATYPKKVVMTLQRRQELLQRSMTASQSGRLQNEYLKMRNMKFYGIPLAEQKSDPKVVAMCERAIRSLQQGDVHITPPRKRKAVDPEPVEHAWDDDADESSIPF